MRFGGDPKQNKTLAILFAVLAVILYLNYFSGPDATPTVRRRPSSIAPTAEAPNLGRRPDEKKRAQANTRAQEFRPRVGSARPEDRLDPMTVDPTLRLDQLSRLESVKISGGARSLFDFSNVNSPAAIAQIIPPPRLKPPPAFIGPMPAPPPPTQPPKVVVAKPQAPPIPLKFYAHLPLIRTQVYSFSHTHTCISGKYIKHSNYTMLLVHCIVAWGHVAKKQK